MDRSRCSYKVVSLHKTKEYTQLLVVVMFFCWLPSYSQVFSGQRGKVKLRGEAPQEIITAESTSLTGKVDLVGRKFNFKQPLNTFSFSQGELQKKHAEESYFEVKLYPNATFTGEIINDLPIIKNGTYNVTARGKFNLHGVEKEMKIPVVITLEDDSMTVVARFTIYLSDYNIKIPRLVSLKVSQEFSVDLSLKMSRPNL